MKDIEHIKEKIKSFDLKNWDDLYTFLMLRDEYFFDKKKLPIEVFNNMYLDEELNASLKDILSDDFEIKLKASKYLEKIPRMETDNRREAWLKDPRTISILIKALDDSNEDVIGNISRSLGEIVKRYHYSDDGIFNKIISNYNKVSIDTKFQIATSLGWFPTQEKWDYLYDALSLVNKTKQKEVLARVISWDYENMPKEYIEKFILVILDYLKKEKNKATIRSLKTLQEELGKIK